MVKIGVSGLGRIGRMLVWHLLSDGYDLSVIYDPCLDVHQAVYLLKHDSIHRKSSIGPEIYEAGEHLIVSGKRCRFIHNDCFNPADFENVDVLVECSGRKEHIDALIENCRERPAKCVITWKGESNIPMVIRGVNHEGENWKKNRLISAGSCTGHCVIPVLNVLMKRFTVEAGIFNVLHPYLSSQGLLDNPSRGPDPSYWRAASLSVIPAGTGLQRSIARIFPEAAHRFQAICYRVPVPIVLTIDANIMFKTPVSGKNIEEALREEAVKNPASGLTVVSEFMVSQDFVDTPWSAAVDVSHLSDKASIQKLILWQDNEWGYARRMADLIGDYMFDRREEEGGRTV